MADSEQHSLADRRPSVQADLALNDQDLDEKLPSGTQSKFVNRLAWASVYLVKAGALTRIKRGVLQITDRGRELLRENPVGITINMLQRYPEFRHFRQTSSIENETFTGIESSQRASVTPEEQLEASYKIIRESLGADLLDLMKKSTPAFFEKLVVELLVAMGYGGSVEDAGKAVGRSGDEGVDGIIKEDKLGLDNLYVQAKRWAGTVGRPIVQAFAGSLEGHRARKGVLITTSTFSQDALDYVQKIEKKIVLIDGSRLAELMIENNVGVTKGRTYIVQKIDLDYFDEL